MRRWRASELESLKGCHLCLRLAIGHCALLLQIKTHLSTTLAHVRLLSGVDTLMYGQGRSLDELFTAIGIVTNVRSDSSVDALCVTVRP